MSGQFFDAQARPLPSQPAQNESTVINPGSTVERQLKGGETHSFTVRLAAGQFLRAAINQKGIDILATLVGPDGQKITKVDSPNGRHGVEPLLVVAQAEGDYRIEIVSPGGKTSGRYELTVPALRTATQIDVEHVAAERAFEKGQQLRGERAASSRLAAIEKYKEALRLFQKVNDPGREALTLYAIGVTHAISGEFHKAVEYYRQALPIYRKSGEKAMEATVLNGTGGAYDVLGELQHALEYYDQALSLFRAVGDKSLEAPVLNNIGKIHSDLSEWQKALEYYDKALALFRVAADQRREAIALDNIGVIYSMLGEYQRALNYHLTALPLRRAIKDATGEANTLTNIGYVSALAGEPKTALENYNQALPLRRASGDRWGEASTLDKIGLAHSLLGEPQKSLEYYEKALVLLRAVEDRRGEAITRGNIGDAYTSLRQFEKAIESYSLARSLFIAVGDRRSEAKVLHGIAAAERSRGNLAEARGLIEAGLEIIESLRAKVGVQQLRATFFATMQDSYKLYIDLLMQMHGLHPSAGHDAEALQASERARARILLEALSGAATDIRQGADALQIERERGLLKQVNLKAAQLMRLQALKQSEQAATAAKELDGLMAQYQDVQLQIRAKSPHYAALTQPVSLSAKEIQRQVLDPDTMLLEYALNKERSFLWAVTSTSIASFQLPASAELEAAALRVYKLLTARNLRVKFETPEERRERVAKADLEFQEAASALSRMLLGPVADQLGRKRLLIVAEGALQYVPFGALPAPATSDRPTPSPTYLPLIVEHEVVSLPSASMIPLLRQEIGKRKAPQKTAAVLADPVFSKDDPRVRKEARGDAPELSQPATGSEFSITRLPSTRVEAEAILGLVPQRESLKALDFAANAALARSPELGRYRILHFATHGFIDDEHAELSGIALSLVDEKGRPQDGFLRLNEIYNLNLPADLVVLSGCKTGLGKEVKGEGVIGLTRGFIYAGAARVVVSLWDVNDAATAELMKNFYKGMFVDKLSPMAALRSAQIAIWKKKDLQSPYYWAPFVPHGEWK